MLRCLLCLLNLKSSLVIRSASYIIKYWIMQFHSASTNDLNFFLDAVDTLFFVAFEKLVANHLLKIFWTKYHLQQLFTDRMGQGRVIHIAKSTF